MWCRAATFFPFLAGIFPLAWLALVLIVLAVVLTVLAVVLAVLAAEILAFFAAIWASVWCGNGSRAAMFAPPPYSLSVLSLEAIGLHTTNEPDTIGAANKASAKTWVMKVECILNSGRQWEDLEYNRKDKLVEEYKTRREWRNKK